MTEVTEHAHNRFIILFTLIIHRKQIQKIKKNVLNLTVLYREKSSGAVQQLAHRGWHQENRQEGGTDWRREKR